MHPDQPQAQPLPWLLFQKADQFSRRPAGRRTSAYLLLAVLVGGAFQFQYIAHNATLSLCGKHPAGIPACLAQFRASIAEQEAAAAAAAGGEAAHREADRRAALANEAAWRRVKDIASRTRVAEADWGRPATAEFANHSVIKLPACGPGERPGFGFGAAEKPPSGLPNLMVHYEPYNGHLLLDLYTDVPDGMLWADPSVVARVAVFCVSGNVEVKP